MLDDSPVGAASSRDLPAPTLHWQRTTPYSLHARGTHYRYSRSHGATRDDTRYTLWHGPLLREQQKYESVMPERIGLYASADAAMAACAEDMAAHPERAPLPDLDLTLGGTVDWAPAREALHDHLDRARASAAPLTAEGLG
jgi:hypothetical protein